ncbi:triadin-like [Helianthus annuus]|uniref:triadin-like n=1 Tax=Helianthus annuus TaxID=4232 RepID=UPI00165334E4|nr:triadin-like [Helianthus annuus]
MPPDPMAKAVVEIPKPFGSKKVDVTLNAFAEEKAKLKEKMERKGDKRFEEEKKVFMAKEYLKYKAKQAKWKAKYEGQGGSDTSISCRLQILLGKVRELEDYARDLSKEMSNLPPEAGKKQELIAAKVGPAKTIAKWSKQYTDAAYERLEKRRKADPNLPKKPIYKDKKADDPKQQRKRQKQTDAKEAKQEAVYMKEALKRMIEENHPDSAKLQEVAKSLLSWPSSPNSQPIKTLPRNPLNSKILKWKSDKQTHIESHDLELQKQSKMTESSRQQNVGLYYKSSVLSEKGVGSPKTAFVEEDRNDIVRKTAHGKATTAPRKFANVAEIKEEKEPAKNHEEKIENKEKTREEILSEKTHKERDVVYRRMDEMQEEYENAVSNKRWDKKKECYYNREGEPVAEEVETEAVKVEAVKEVEEQQIEEEEMKDVKSDAGDVGEEVSVEQKLNDAEMKQPEEAENTEVPNTEVFLKKTEYQPKEKRSSLAPEAADPCNG